MKTTNKKLITLALVAIAIIFFGSEIAIAFVTDAPYTTNQIRPWFAITIGAIYYVWATQISETSKNKLP